MAANTAIFNLSDLNGSNGFIINDGISGFDFLGSSLSNAGDINGDGFDDIIIGASNASPNGKLYAGKSYVVFGNSSGFGASLNLSSLNGSKGFAINGIDAFDRLGSSVSNAGDINGDGFDDIIIGAPDDYDFTSNDSQSLPGASYVIFGKSSGFEASLNLSSLNGSNGFAIAGITDYDRLGSSVSNAGDINGDGFDDLIIRTGITGTSYVVFGKSSGFGASFDISTLNGSNGFAIAGINSSSVSNAGDINGDGFDDLIGASSAAPDGKRNAGESYIIFGKSSAFEANFNISTLNGSNGFVIKGIKNDDYSGSSVRNAGDINGDGFDDIIISASNASPNGQVRAGEIYVVFGSSSDFGASLELSALNGSNGFVISGIDAFDFLGSSVSSAGDFNGDGFDDLIIGVNSADTNGKTDAGQSYLVFGKSNGFEANLNLLSLDGSNGLVINGIDEFDRAGSSVSGAGDINGDGFDDLLIAAGGLNKEESYVIFGFATATANADTATTKEDTAVNILLSDILRKYADIDGDPLSITSFSNPTNGTLTLNENGTVGNTNDDYFVYKPNANYNGTDSFSYIVSDGNGGSIGGTFSLTIKGVNDAPSAVNDTVSAAKNTAVSIPIKTLLANDTDVDSSNLSVTGVSDASNGTAVLNNNGSPSNLADDFIVFAPTAGFSGAANFKYTVSDGQLTSTAKVTVQVGDRFFGGNGKDTLKGTAGNDIICGGNGNDTIYGGNGKDTIYGGVGNDILTGGKGQDKFILVAGNGTDTITDFCKGKDLIGLSGCLTFNQLSFSGNNIIVTATEEILASLTGIDTTTLTATNFTTI